MDIKSEKFDIIIQGGQSNAEGCGKGAVAQEFVPSENILYLQAVKQTFVDEVNLHITFPEVPFQVSVASELREHNEILGDFSLKSLKVIEVLEF